MKGNDYRAPMIMRCPQKFFTLVFEGHLIYTGKTLWYPVMVSVSIMCICSVCSVCSVCSGVYLRSSPVCSSCHFLLSVYCFVVIWLNLNKGKELSIALFCLLYERVITKSLQWFYIITATE